MPINPPSRPNALVSLKALAEDAGTNLNLVRACLCAEGIVPMFITHSAGTEEMAPGQDSRDAIAKHRDSFTPAIRADEVVRKLLEKLIPALSATIRPLLMDATDAGLKAAGKAQRVVDTVIQCSEQGIQQGRKTQVLVEQQVATLGKQIVAELEKLNGRINTLGHHVQCVEQSLDRLQVYALLPAQVDLITKNAAALAADEKAKARADLGELKPIPPKRAKAKKPAPVPAPGLRPSRNVPTSATGKPKPRR